MREINVSKIRDAVSGLCLKANFELRPDIAAALRAALKRETLERARAILVSIVENAKIARAKRIAICQDTGMVCVHIALGQQVSLVGGSLRGAVNDGIRDAYTGGCLRKSVVADPLVRENTGTNAPCVISTEIVDGDKVDIDVSPKGFGSENKSRIKMFKPTASVEEIKRFVLEVVEAAGPDACPPLVLGIGIGGTFETAAALSKRALLRPIDKRNPKRHFAKLERELLKEINALGLGPMGLGGRTTALGVNIVEHPAHIAGLPVAVNVSCHATRSASRTI
jgi:fumarate hydratase subunit alpha